jgi:hypothetical protein
MLPEARIKVAEHGHTAWAFPVPGDWTPEDAMGPTALSRRFERFRVGDTVEMWNDPPDTTWWVKALVVAVDPVMKAISLVPLLAPIDLTQHERAKPDFSRATIEECDGATRWRVRYGHTELVSGLDSRAKAEAWLAKRQNGAARPDAQREHQGADRGSLHAGEAAC